MNILGGSVKEKEGVIGLDEANRRIGEMIKVEADRIVRLWIKSSEEQRLKAVLGTMELREVEIQNIMRVEDQLRRAVINSIQIITASLEEAKKGNTQEQQDLLQRLPEYLQSIINNNPREEVPKDA